jgi:signal transduction histidine kinase
VRAHDVSPSVIGTSSPAAWSVSPRVVALGVPGGRQSRLARDLHDGVGQSIIGLLVDIRVAIERGYASRDDLLIIERETENALNALRALAYQVRTRSPLVDPFAQARLYAEHLLVASGSTLRWIDDREGRRLSPRVATELACSIREAVTNAIAHGRARLVEVRLAESEGRIRISVRDDGVGFEPESLEPTPEGRGLGLLGTAERMAEVGGIFTLRSRPGEGTVVVLEAPRFPGRRMAVRPSMPAPVSADPERQPAAVAAG